MWTSFFRKVTTPCQWGLYLMVHAANPPWQLNAASPPNHIATSKNNDSAFDGLKINLQCLQCVCKHQREANSKNQTSAQKWKYCSESHVPLIFWDTTYYLQKWSGNCCSCVLSKWMWAYHESQKLVHADAMHSCSNSNELDCGGAYIDDDDDEWCQLRARV